MKKSYKLIKTFVVLLCIATFKLAAQPLSGLYTINAAQATGGTNFQTFNAFVTALTTTAGVSGSVTVDVVANSGPYTEQIIIPQVVGMSLANNLTINGNGNTIQFNASTLASMWTICYNGLDYTTINDLVVDAQGSQYGYACNLTNSSNFNNFNRCAFKCPLNGTSSYQVPFSISGNNTSATTFGNGGQFNTVTTCTMTSGYYNTTSCGLTSPPYTEGNSFINCRMTDFYLYGIFAPYSKNTSFINCLIDRPTRTLLTTTYGAYCYYSQGLLFDGCRMINMYAGSPGAFSTFFGFYNYGHPIANGIRNVYRNNIISNIQNNGTCYGFYTYNSGSDHYNNTIDFDYAAGTSQSTVWGFYPYSQNGFANTITNNIITINRGGNAISRYGMYIALSGNITVDRNLTNMTNLGVPFYQNYLNGVQGSLTSWQGQFCDVNGFSVTPQYVNQPLGDLHPSNVAIDNAASPLGLLFDQIGALRNGVTPDIGALEFLTPACVGTPTVGGITSPTFAICPGGTANLGVINPNVAIGVTYQWQSSTTSSVGPFAAIPNATSVAYSAPNLTTTTWFTPLITCTNSNQNVSPVAQVNIAGTTTNSVPYFEGFEAIGINNRLPNCSWAADGLGFTSLTNSVAVVGSYANSGNGFARHSLGSAGSNYFYSNGIQMNAGVTYSAAIMYMTEFLGNTNWSDLSIMIGSAQTPTALTTIVSTNGPAVAPVYRLLSNTFTVASSGIYYIAIKGTRSAAAGAAFIHFDDVSVTAPCSINTSTIAISGISTICSGKSATLTASGASSYTWSTGATLSSVVVSPPTTNLYSVIGRNLAGCTTTVTQLVTVNQSPVLSIFSSPSNTVCDGASLNLTSVGAASSYTWLPSGSNNNGITVNPSTTTTYTLSGSSSNGCVGSVSQVISVNPKPAVTAASANGNNVCVTDVTSLLANGAINYTWQSNNIFLQGASVQVSPNSNTTYTVTGTDNNGCSNTATVQLIVSACVGINNISASAQGINIYPNPNNGEFTVELNNGINKKISITDLSGKVILSANTSDNKINFNLNKFAVGMYYVKIQSGNITEVLKVVKQ